MNGYNRVRAVRDPRCATVMQDSHHSASPRNRAAPAQIATAVRLNGPPNPATCGPFKTPRATSRSSAKHHIHMLRTMPAMLQHRKGPTHTNSEPTMPDVRKKGINKRNGETEEEGERKRTSRSFLSRLNLVFPSVSPFLLFIFCRLR